MLTCPENTSHFTISGAPTFRSSHYNHPRSIFKIKKISLSLKMKTEREQKERKEEVKRDVFEQLGSPSSPYINNKIDNLFTASQLIYKRKFQSSRRNDKSQETTLGTSCTFLSECDNPERKHHSEEKRTVFQSAYVKNQKQKLSRILQKKKQDEQKFQTLSQNIKIKLKPKKLKIQYCRPSHVQEDSWYQDWNRSFTKMSENREGLLLRKMKTSENRRFHTQDIMRRRQNE